MDRYDEEAGVFLNIYHSVNLAVQKCCNILSDHYVTNGTLVNNNNTKALIQQDCNRESHLEGTASENVPLANIAKTAWGGGDSPLFVQLYSTNSSLLASSKP